MNLNSDCPFSVPSVFSAVNSFVVRFVSFVRCKKSLKLCNLAQLAQEDLPDYQNHQG